MITLLLFSFFVLGFGGQIHSHDIIVAPNNLNTLSQFTFTFSLDNAISSDDYLRIIFPFQVNSVDNAFWGLYESCSTSNPDKAASVVISAVPGDTDTYFVQFFTDLTETTRDSLSANTTYFITFEGIIDSTTTIGIQLPIQVLTVSNNAGNWITYDSNAAFGVIDVADEYPITMTVSFTIAASETDKNDLGADYDITIDFTPTVTLNNRARIDIEMTNPDFQILSCTTVTSGFAGILSLPSTYTALSSSKVRAIISQTVYAGNGVKYRYKCTVRNPTLPATGGITVTNWNGWADSVTEQGTQASGLQASSSAGTTVNWDETKHKILLGWGYEASNPNAIDAFAIYRDADATEKWYQSVMTVFRPAQDLTTILNLNVIVTTLSDAGFTILQSTIHHNLPDFSTSDKVTCTASTGYLTCENVGQLQAISYFISFRFNVASTTTVTSAIDFGKVEVETMAGVPLISLSQTGLTHKTIVINPNLFHTGGADGRIAQSTTTSGSLAREYVANGENIDLDFTFNYFSSDWVPLTTGSFIDRGIEFYTSYALTPLAGTPTCSIDTITSGDATITDCTISTTSNSFTRLRFRLAEFLDVSGAAAALFTDPPSTGTITFTPVLFTSSQFSSLSIVSQNVFDYYVRWVQGFDATSPTITLDDTSNPFFFNSLVYSEGALASTYVGLSFFYTGTGGGDTPNEGTYFPTLLRVTGELAPSEQSGADRLLVFFNDLVPLDLDNPCFGPAGVTCRYIDGGLSNTATDDRTDYSGSKRIEIDTDLSQLFNIYIPVATVAAKTDIGFFLATASEINTTTNTQGKFTTRHSKRVDVWSGTNTVSGSTPPITAAGGTLLTVPGSTEMGSVVASTTIDTFGSLPTANSGSNIGAGYGYCADFDFASDSGFALEPFYTGGTASDDQLCVKIDYTVNDEDVYCYVCPVHDTMSGSVAVTKITMPTDAGRDFYNGVIVVSEDTGDLLDAIYDQQADVFDAVLLTDHSITFQPDDITMNGKNVLTSLKFTPSVAIPGTLQLHILFSGTSSSLNMGPVTDYPCSCTTVELTSCTISGDDTDIIIDIVAAEDYFQITEHEIIFMVDSTDPVLSGDATVEYKIQIIVDGINPLTPIHHESNDGSFTMIDAPAELFELDKLNYLFGSQKARTTITFEFTIPSDMMVHPEQSINFDLGGIADENDPDEPLCYVRAANSLDVSTDFLSCDLTALDAVVLKTNKAITGTYVLVLEYILAHDAVTDDIVGTIIAVDGTTVLATSAGLELPDITPATAFPVANVELSRTYKDAGTAGELLFTIIPTAARIDEESYIYAYFPNYYSGNLGYDTLSCTGNDEPISCFTIGERVIRFTAFSSRVAIGDTLEIRIFGIITPIVPATPGKIFIAFDDDDDTSTLLEQIEIDDVDSSSTTPDSLPIRTYTVSNTKIRQTHDVTFTFKTDSDGIDANHVIAIDFPDRYGPALIGSKAPKIEVNKQSSTVVTSIQTSTFGSRFKILLPLDLEPLTTYQFKIKGIHTAELETCNMDFPTITVTDISESAALYRSAPNNFDADRIDYESDSSLTTLGFADKNGDELISLVLAIGIYSEEIRIAPPTGQEFTNDIIFSISYPEIELEPALLRARAGEPYLSFRVVASTENLPSTVLLSFSKTESVSTSAYTNLPRLKLLLTNYQKMLPTPAISIMLGGTSLPYYWDLEELDMIPYEQVKVEATIAAPHDDFLSILGASTLVFTPDNKRVGFTFLLDDSANPLTPPEFTLSVSGKNGKNYGFAEPTVKVTVIPAVTTAPVISAKTITSHYAPTSQQFSLTMNQVCAVYWHVALQDKLVTEDCLRITENALDNSIKYDIYDIAQAQYGVMYAYQAAVATTFTVQNLMADTTYSYVLCPVSQMDKKASATKGTFETDDNGADTSEVIITFSQPIPKTQIAPFVCLLMIELQLPNENVVAMDGTTCQEALNMDDYSSYDYANVAIYVTGNKRTDETQTVTSSLSSWVNSINRETPSAFRTKFILTLTATGLSNLFSEINVESGPTYTTQSMDVSELSMIAQPTYFVLSGIKLENNGYIFGIADEGELNIPYQHLIKKKMNADSLSVSGANFYYTGDADAVTLNFTDLTPETIYKLYYYASNTDLSQYAYVTDVKVLTFQTLNISFGTNLQTAFVSMLLMLCAIFML